MHRLECTQSTHQEYQQQKKHKCQHTPAIFPICLSHCKDESDDVMSNGWNTLTHSLFHFKLSSDSTTNHHITSSPQKKINFNWGERGMNNRLHFSKRAPTEVCNKTYPLTGYSMCVVGTEIVPVLILSPVLATHMGRITNGELVSRYFEPSQSQRITSGLKTNFNLSPSYSAHKSCHKYFKICKISLDTNLHKTYTHKHQTRWHREPYSRFIY